MCKILYFTGALIGLPNNRNYKLLKPLSKELLCDGITSDQIFQNNFRLYKENVILV